VPLQEKNAPTSSEKTPPLLWRLVSGRLPLMILILFLLAWEWGARAKLISTLFFPPPTVIFETLIDQLFNDDLSVHLSHTLLRIVLGFGIGGSTALLLGFFMGWSKGLRRVVDPFIAALHPMPKVSLLPLIMIIFGIGERSRLVIVALVTFFPILISTVAAVRQIDPTYFDVARSYGARPLKTLWRVVLPGSLPIVLSGVRLGMNSALVLTITVEIITAQWGLGAVVWLAWETFRVEEVYAALVIIALLGLAINRLLVLLTRRLLPWQADRQLAR
jgi:NitT/TauT family transport system permease protein